MATKLKLELDEKQVTEALARVAARFDASGQAADRSAQTASRSLAAERAQIIELERATQIVILRGKEFQQVLDATHLAAAQELHTAKVRDLGAAYDANLSRLNATANTVRNVQSTADSAHASLQRMFGVSQLATRGVAVVRGAGNAVGAVEAAAKATGATRSIVAVRGLASAFGAAEAAATAFGAGTAAALAAIAAPIALTAAAIYGTAKAFSAADAAGSQFTKAAKEDAASAATALKTSFSETVQPALSAMQDIKTAWIKGWKEIGQSIDVVVKESYDTWRERVNDVVGPGFVADPRERRRGERLAGDQGMRDAEARGRAAKDKRLAEEELALVEKRTAVKEGMDKADAKREKDAKQNWLEQKAGVNELNEAIREQEASIRAMADTGPAAKREREAKIKALRGALDRTPESGGRRASLLHEIATLRAPDIELQERISRAEEARGRAGKPIGEHYFDLIQRNNQDHSISETERKDRDTSLRAELTGKLKESAAPFDAQIAALKKHGGASPEEIQKAVDQREKLIAARDDRLKRQAAEQAAEQKEQARDLSAQKLRFAEEELEREKGLAEHRRGREIEDARDAIARERHHIEELRALRLDTQQDNATNVEIIEKSDRRIRDSHQATFDAEKKLIEDLEKIRRKAEDEALSKVTDAEERIREQRRITHEREKRDLQNASSLGAAQHRLNLANSDQDAAYHEARFAEDARNRQDRAIAEARKPTELRVAGAPNGAQDVIQKIAGGITGKQIADQIIRDRAGEPGNHTDRQSLAKLKRLTAAGHAGLLNDAGKPTAVGKKMAVAETQARDIKRERAKYLREIRVGENSPAAIRRRRGQAIASQRDTDKRERAKAAPRDRMALGRMQRQRMQELMGRDFTDDGAGSQGEQRTAAAKLVQQRAKEMQASGQLAGTIGDFIQKDLQATQAIIQAFQKLQQQVQQAGATLDQLTGAGNGRNRAQAAGGRG